MKRDGDRYEHQHFAVGEEHEVRPHDGGDREAAPDVRDMRRRVDDCQQHHAAVPRPR